MAIKFAVKFINDGFILEIKNIRANHVGRSRYVNGISSRIYLQMCNYLKLYWMLNLNWKGYYGHM